MPNGATVSASSLVMTGSKRVVWYNTKSSTYCGVRQVRVGCVFSTSWPGWLQGDSKDLWLVSVFGGEGGVERVAGTGGGVGGGNASCVVWYSWVSVGGAPGIWWCRWRQGGIILVIGVEARTTCVMWQGRWSVHRYFVALSLLKLIGGALQLWTKNSLTYPQAPSIDVTR